ncbi:MAG: hypothetical protein ABIK43_00290 [candidate division WOR-3 bacterium]
MRRMAGLVSLIAVLSTTGATALSDPYSSYEWRFGAEFGAVQVLSHTIQFGRAGTRFDYVQDGGQNILFPFSRISAELHLKPRHTAVLLYQPLDVVTRATLRQPLVIDEDTFPAGAAMNLRYGFDFYRFSYLYDFLPASERELSAGISLQLRNASIAFTAVDGSRQRVYNDLGPVPALKLRLRVPLSERTWFGTEIDGIYAQGRVVTGSNNVESSFRGALLDASLRYGMQLGEGMGAFFNVRYLGGGASGGQVEPENPGDGYVDNWLGTLALTVGLQLR